MFKRIKNVLEKNLSIQKIPLEVSILEIEGTSEKDILEYRKKIDDIQNNFFNYRKNQEVIYEDNQAQKAHEIFNFFSKKNYTIPYNKLKKTIDTWRKGDMKGACFSFTSLYNIIAEREGLNVGVIFPTDANHILSVLKTPKKLYAIENTWGDGGFDMNYNKTECFIGGNNALISEYIRINYNKMGYYDERNKSLELAIKLDPKNPMLYREKSINDFGSIRLFNGTFNISKYSKAKEERHKLFSDYQRENNSNYLNYDPKNLVSSSSLGDFGSHIHTRIKTRDFGDYIK